MPVGSGWVVRRRLLILALVIENPCSGCRIETLYLNANADDDSDNDGARLILI